MNGQHDAADADYAASAGFLSKRAFDDACHCLIARSGGYDINGVSLRLGGEV